MVPTLTCGLPRSNFSLAMCGVTSLGLCLLKQPGEGSENAALRSLRLTAPVLDDLLGDVGRNFLVLLELHGVGGPTLGHGPHVRGVAEHLAERDVSRDGERVAALLLALDPAA